MSTTNTTHPDQVMKLMSRTDYKEIKSFNRDKLSKYVHGVYTNGYKAGYEARIEESLKSSTKHQNEKHPEQSE